MTKAKKILFLARIGLTVLLWQCILPIVKTQRHILLKTKQPDTAGELRIRKDRRATLCAPQLSCFIRSFCALSTGSRCIVETHETKNQVASACQVLKRDNALIEKLKKDVIDAKMKLLECIYILQAGEEFLFNDDLMDQLKIEQERFESELSEVSETVRAYPNNPEQRNVITAQTK